MSSPFQQQFSAKSPLNVGNIKDDKIAVEKLPEVDLGTVKSNYEGKKKKLPFPGKEMYEGKGDYAQYKGKYTKDMLDMNANYTYQHNKANKPGYVEGKKRQMEAEGLSPLPQLKNPDRTRYQDSVKTLHKPAHVAYLKRKKEGFSISDDDGQTFNQIAPETDPTKIKNLKEFWQSIGSKVKIMSAEEHDKILSLTSHLPHAIAYNIVRTVINVEDKLKQEVIQYSAGGLRDFTRIAASNPLMWKDIFLDNSENISKGIDSFIEKLNELKKAVNDKNGDKLFQIFNSTKEVRKEIIKAGQDTNKPDFGRKKD